MVSALGVVPKKAVGEYRLIHHLSWPDVASVNDFINQAESLMSSASVDPVIQLVHNCGVGAEMGKADIKSDFRLLPVHPDDFHLLGI